LISWGSIGVSTLSTQIPLLSALPFVVVGVISINIVVIYRRRQNPILLGEAHREGE
jgi:hypothetical protein